MNLSRRGFFGSAATLGGLLGLAATPRAAHADVGAPPARVTTLNGRSLRPRVRDGVKEFHLIAEEIEHEFAPGMKIKAWGYNGSTPGPTIEATEGDRVRIYVTNRLPEHTTIHWHGIHLPNGMDGVGGLTQPQIKPGETYVYEFTLRQHGTHMYHPHADEMVQIVVGMMGMFIIHPKDGEPERIDRDYAFLLHNWARAPRHLAARSFGDDRLRPVDLQQQGVPGDRPAGRAHRRARAHPHRQPVHARAPDPPARARVRVTGGDGGRWPRTLLAARSDRDRRRRPDRATSSSCREPGDWALHCHKSHHTMNAMGHGVPNPLGVDQRGVAEQPSARCCRTTWRWANRAWPSMQDTPRWAT